MTLADMTHSTYHLLTAGPVPLWAGILLFVAALMMVLWQLRRDFSGVKLKRPLRWLLATLRFGIVAMIAWLLCQPVLVVEKHWTLPPQVMLVVDGGGSMGVNESAGDLSRKLDMLEAVGKQPIAKRNNAGSRTARACETIGRAALATFVSLQEDQGAASTGLPLGPAVERKIDELAALLRGQGDLLISARAQLPTDVQLPTGDKELKPALAELVSSSQRVGATVDATVADGVIVGREARKSPKLLDDYLVRLKKLAADADSVRRRAADVQQKLDKTMLTAREIEEIRAKAMTRQSLADMAGDRLATVFSMVSSQAPSANSGPASWDRAHSSTLATALDDVFRKSLETPLAGVVLLSDGSAPLPAGNGAAGSALARLTVPVNTVLIGADGEEPPDAGLVAVDVPRLALAGDAVTLRCLVKNLVATPTPRLTLTIGKQTIATRDLTVTKTGYEVVEFSWTPAAPGRFQLVFRVESAQPDAYPGNESSAAIVDVIANKAHVLIVTDRLSGDFAAVSQLLAAMPAVDSRTILAAPGLSKFHTGSRSDEFPGAPADFKALSLVVLIGNVPNTAGNDAIAALKQTVDAGLRVWIQESTETAPAAGKPATHWSEALGIETRPITGRHSIQPANGLWLDLFQLGRESNESEARWKAFPPVSGLSEIVAPGIPLLTVDGRPVLEIVPRQAGAVIVSGIGDFTALRSSGSTASVNRLLAESLNLGLTPISEPGMTGGVFPPQPVFGRNVLLIGDAGPGKGLEPVVAGASTPNGMKIFRVTDPQSIGAQIGAAQIERIVRHLLSRQDFQLAAHAAPLEKIAKETGGRHRDLFSATDVLPQDLKGTTRSSTARFPLWPGQWSLFVILGLVSAEYLLRRRAGKVM